MVEVWSSYRDHTAWLIRIQQAQAEAAAAKIGQFIEQIEAQLGWTTQFYWSEQPPGQRQADAFRLLRLVPPVTELARLDPAGHEQLHVSREEATVVGSNIDFSQDPKFIEAMGNGVYYGPVYFREATEPYMTLAVGRRGAGATVAEISLKYIWDVVAGIKVGEHGAAYVVDASGKLIAHPDLSLVLRNTDLSGLAQVKAARARDARRAAAPGGRYVGSAGAHRQCGDHAAGLARLRRTADQRGLRPALRLALHTRRRCC